MKIYCMSDIHGNLNAFEDSLKLVLDHLKEEDTMLLLLGDYIHGGDNNRGVIDRIMKLETQYGSSKVKALLGNHESWFLNGIATIDSMKLNPNQTDNQKDDDIYYNWIKKLPLFYLEGNTIFCHAGINEDNGELWYMSTDNTTFTEKYPHQTGKVLNLDKKIVAGHISTEEISGVSGFHDIFYDGESHYYIDGGILNGGSIPVLLVDTKNDKYYQVTSNGISIIEPTKTALKEKS